MFSFFAANAFDSTAPSSTPMSKNYHQFIGRGDSGGDDDDDDRSTQSSIGMATCDENFTADHRQFNDAIQGGGGGGGGTDEDVGVDDDYRAEEAAAEEDEDDAATIEAMNAVTRERTMTHQENARKLQSILQNIKNSIKNILAEMDTYLQETAEVEKTYIRCKANTEKESRRMERVEPDVIAATQREYMMFLHDAGISIFQPPSLFPLLSLGATSAF